MTYYIMKKGLKMASLQKISTTAKYAILQEAVKDYPGILSATETLFRELTRYPCDWDCTVREMRTYALKNFYIHDRHEKGAEVISTIIDVFLEAILSAEVPVRQSAVDTLLFYLEKIMVDSNNALSRYSSIFKGCFQSLKKLQDDQFFILVTNPHQLKKLGRSYLQKCPKNLTSEVLMNFSSGFFS